MVHNSRASLPQGFAVIVAQHLLRSEMQYTRTQTGALEERVGKG